MTVRKWYVRQGTKNYRWSIQNSSGEVLFSGEASNKFTRERHISEACETIKRNNQNVKIKQDEQL